MVNMPPDTILFDGKLLTKDEWMDICLDAAPDLTEEEFEALWSARPRQHCYLH